MSNYDNIVNILKSIGLSQSHYHKMAFYDEYYALWQYKEPPQLNQYGGVKSKIILSDGIEYKFYKTSNDNEIIYALHAKDNTILKCITIIINKQFRTAYLHELGNHKGCIVIGLIADKGGSILMSVALKLIKKLKDRYNLKYVYLIDNAHKTLFDDKGKAHSVKLSHLMFLTKGITYYEKFGFKPTYQDGDGNVEIRNLELHN